MQYVKGDLLKGDWGVAAHVCNNHVVMGSGVAYHLSKKWPEVLKADEEFNEDEDNWGIHKMGKFSLAHLPDGRKVYNLYAMHGIGNDGHPLNRNCQYDALYNALYKMCENLDYIIFPN
jgi:O-acetyl-ADP-ribose deacetylase (regulator of RNase III)